jgi:hypothetical protein
MLPLPLMLSMDALTQVLWEQAFLTDYTVFSFIPLPFYMSYFFIYLFSYILPLLMLLSHDFLNTKIHYSDVLLIFSFIRIKKPDS